MAVHLLNRRQQVAIETEATEGTAETLVAADVHFRARSSTFTIEAQTTPQDLLQADLSELPDIMGQLPVTITTETLLAGGSAVDTAAGWSEALIPAGFLETVNSSTSCVYTPETPVTTNSCTVGVWVGPDSGTNGRLFIAKGCRVESVAFTFNAGEPAVMAVTWRGAYSSHADAAVFSGASYDATVPPASQKLGLSLTLSGGAWTPFWSSLSLNINNTLAAVDDLNTTGETSGILAYRVTGRRIEGTIDPLEVRQADNDWMVQLQSGADGAMTWTLGTATGNKVQFTMPQVQILSHSPGEKEGMMNQSLSFKANRSSGNDELTITTT